VVVGAGGDGFVCDGVGWEEDWEEDGEEDEDDDEDGRGGVIKSASEPGREICNSRGDLERTTVMFFSFP
jgi:hypothetical protein